jgi:tripartite-type tricarboxylate transporter receptor subunit TctC
MMTSFSSSLMRTALLAAGAICLSVSGVAHAQQDYPNRSIRIVVPWPAGGATDNVARVVAQKLSPILNQPVVVENRPGATGTIGTQAVIQSPPDGYTLLFMAASLHTFSPHLMKSMPFDTVADVTPISISVQFPYVLAVSAESPYKSVDDLIKAAKAQPGKLAYGSFGVGSGPHIVSELFRQQVGIDVFHVPYKGGAQVTAGLLGGDIPFMFDSLPSPLGHIRGGRLRALAVTSAKRAPAAPDVPTLAESGIDIEAIIWLGLGGPANLPAEVVAKLFDAMKQIAADPDHRKRIETMGAEATTSSSPQDFRTFMIRERERWGKVIQDAKISPES